jgi:hypothetical protein
MGGYKVVTERSKGWARCSGTMKDASETHVATWLDTRVVTL